MKVKRLGVNIDHIATLREARKEWYPDPLQSLTILKKCRVHQVTIHLREDRRHIQDNDVKKIITAQELPVNLELALNEKIIRFALKHKPQTCTFVPEKREEITTEGGLDCQKYKTELRGIIKKFKKMGISTSLFIEADKQQILAAKDLDVDAIEIHTGRYCALLEKFFLKNHTYDFVNTTLFSQTIQNEVNKIKTNSVFAAGLGLKVYAGHGLHAGNLFPLVAVSEIEEYNIGHAIIAQAVFHGLEKAIKQIQKALVSFHPLDTQKKYALTKK